MSDEENKVDEAREDDDNKDDAVEETSEAEGEDTKDDAAEPPKKRARKAAAAAAAPKAKSEKKAAAAGAKKKKRVGKKHPKTMDMIIEAIENLGERKGSSVQAIKAYILQNFKTVCPDMVKSMLRRALTLGLDQGTVARPKGQTDTQVMSGRYLMGKSAKKEYEDEVMPQQSKRAQEAKKSAKKSKKKGGKKSKKVAKKPVAKKATSPKAKTPVKKTKGRK